MLALAAMLTGVGCSIVVDTDGLSGGSSGTPVVSPESGADALADVATDTSKIDGSPPIDAGDPTLVGDWPFDEGSGTKIHDRSGHAHDGVAAGGTWVDDHASQPASALRLGGGSAFVSIEPHADFDRPASARLTLVAWMRSNEEPAHNMFFSVSFGETEQSYGIELITPTQLTYWDGTEHRAVATIAAIGMGWHHYGVVVEDENVRIYFDGVRVSDGRVDMTPRRSTQVLLGRSTFGDRLNGALDKMRYYRRALTDAEIVAEKNR